MTTLYSSVRLCFTEFTSKPDAAGKEKTTSAVMWAARLALLSVTASASAGGALGADESDRLVDRVRAANDRFKNVSVAMSGGCTPIPCASGIDGGAMGIHCVTAKLIGADPIDIKHPQAVMYEPMPDGKPALIAVEYITSKGPASLEGSCLISTAPPIATAWGRSANCMCGPGRRTSTARLRTLTRR